MTAALDLTLSFVEEDHGPELARRVVLAMVTYLQRPGNQAQMSLFTTARRPGDALVRTVLDHATAPSQVARRCGFASAETLRQAFTGRYGISPARFRAAQSSTGATSVTRSDSRRRPLRPAPTESV